MCSIRNCNFEGITWEDRGKRENDKVVYQLFCKYHRRIDV